MADSTTAAPAFDLRALTPARPTFTDADGTNYAVRLPRDLNMVDEATRYNALVDRRAAIERLQAERGDVAAAEAASETLAVQMGILIPDLPAARLAAIGDADKLAFLGWWGELFLAPTSGAAPSGPAPATTSPTSADGSAAPTPATDSPTS